MVAKYVVQDFNQEHRSSSEYATLKGKAAQADNEGRVQFQISKRQDQEL
jgi:hypothetical protein